MEHASEDAFKSSEGEAVSSKMELAFMTYRDRAEPRGQKLCAKPFHAHRDEEQTVIKLVWVNLWKHISNPPLREVC